MINEKFKPEYLFDLDKLQAYLDTKVVRNPRTNTPLDYITDEQLEELNKKNEHNLEKYVPVPEDIKNIIDFAISSYNKLSKKYPNDKYLKFLAKEENYKEKITTNWYERYNLFYNYCESV